MTAAYVFDVAFQVAAAEASLTPNRFETTLRLFAPEPGESGAHIDWLFFRDRLWSGEVSDAGPLCRAASDWLGVEVEHISFKELRTDEAYLDALEDAVAADLTRFNAESTDEALQQYLGSSIHVVPSDEV
ncbi:MAG: LWR-salt protein [Halolamina sp.]